MNYTPPQTIIEAKIRMLNGEKFTYQDYVLIEYHKGNDEFYVTGANGIVNRLELLGRYCQNWLPYKEPEQEFPFQFDELACMRYGDNSSWYSAKYSHIFLDDNFAFIGGGLNREITNFNHDLLGKVCEPTTPVWIVKDGKPCVKNMNVVDVVRC